ncbi:MAG: prolyl oligopeptidase family serine peptidase [Pirellulaceae bacterium]|nr:prolyl oligopeptidase family serine peptidase [Pirellulaceae bacterium]
MGPMDATPSSNSPRKNQYPEARREAIHDTFHGVKVADPYRWLEQDVRESKEVQKWVEAENKVTQAYLSAIPERDQIRKRLTKLWNYPKYSAPFQRGGKYFFRKNDGLQNQAVLYVANSADGEARVLLNPNTWTKDGTVALSSAVPSDDARLLAYTASEGGSDWKTLRVMNIESGKLLEDELKWIRWGGVNWLPDGSGFYYARYPKPEAGEQYQALALNQMIYFHQIGSQQSDDQLVYRREDHPDWTFDLTLTDDDQYQVISITKSTDDQNMVLYRKADNPTAPWIELIGDFDNQFWFVGNQDATFYFLTDLDAPTKRVVSISLTQPGRSHLKEIIPAETETLRSATILNEQFVASYLKDATTRVKILSLDGEFVRDVEFPGIGTAGGFRGRPSDYETFYSFSSYDTPSSIFQYDMRTGKSRLWRRSEVDFDPQQFQVKQIFYKSKDGTRVPMFIAHRRDLQLSGDNPTLLYGYGGFNISLTPGFSVSYVAWMEMGGVVAIPNLRGGGEYGEQWHAAGKTVNKQNVFDDFLAAAEWLIAEKYTRPDKLAIQGGSNGGLLVGAAMTQRPDLFGACLPAVGVMDMLRYQHFTAGRFWVDEYGTPDEEAEFKALLRYSPYHNIQAGVDYPATMISTADTDDRVVPMHSFKFAAALQQAQAGPAPILIRIETRAGHGAGKPTSKRIDNIADHWAFLVHVLNVKIPQP